MKAKTSNLMHSCCVFDVRGICSSTLCLKMLKLIGLFRTFIRLIVVAVWFELQSFVHLVDLIPDVWDLVEDVAGTGKIQSLFLKSFFSLGTLPLALLVIHASCLPILRQTFCSDIHRDADQRLSLFPGTSFSCPSLQNAIRNEADFIQL